jgi:hypothetical protein
MSKKAMEDGSFIAMDKCFFCNKDKNILLHTRFADISELHGKVTNYTPCT